MAGVHSIGHFPLSPGHRTRLELGLWFQLLAQAFSTRPGAQLIPRITRAPSRESHPDLGRACYPTDSDSHK